MADVTVTKIAGYVRVRILMNRWFFLNFWDSYFSSYGEFGEFSLRFTAPLSGRSVSNKAAHHITAKIGDAGAPRHVKWAAFRDRRHDEQRGSPYEAKCNVAEIGAVNMGEIGAVRKRSRYYKKRALTTVAHA